MSHFNTLTHQIVPQQGLLCHVGLVGQQSCNLDVALRDGGTQSYCFGMAN